MEIATEKSKSMHDLFAFYSSINGTSKKCTHKQIVFCAETATQQYSRTEIRIAAKLKQWNIENSGNMTIMMHENLTIKFVNAIVVALCEYYLCLSYRLFLPHCIVLGIPFPVDNNSYYYYTINEIRAHANGKRTDFMHTKQMF